MSCLNCKTKKNAVDVPLKEPSKKINKNEEAAANPVEDSRPVETITLSDGSVYTGTIKDNKPDGHGTLTYKNGDIYVGQFVNGKKNGLGKWLESGGDIYDGEWKDDRRNGKGIYTTADGTTLEGSFENNLKHGLGTVTLPDKTRYICTYSNDAEVGTAEFFFSNGDHAFGYIKDGNIDGSGRYEFKNGDVYVGCFKNGIFNGKGYYKWNASSSFKLFEGNYLDGKKHGKGVLKNADGRVFCGNFVHNNLHGEVIETSPQGNKTKVLFKNGAFVKLLENLERDLNQRVYIDEKVINTTIFSDPDAYKKLYEYKRKVKPNVKLSFKDPPKTGLTRGVANK